MKITTNFEDPDFLVSSPEKTKLCLQTFTDVIRAYVNEFKVLPPVETELMDWDFGIATIEAYTIAKTHILVTITLDVEDLEIAIDTNENGEEPKK